MCNLLLKNLLCKFLCFLIFRRGGKKVCIIYDTLGVRGLKSLVLNSVCMIYFIVQVGPFI